MFDKIAIVYSPHTRRVTVDDGSVGSDAFSNASHISSIINKLNSPMFCKYFKCGRILKDDTDYDYHLVERDIGTLTDLAKHKRFEKCRVPSKVEIDDKILFLSIIKAEIVQKILSSLVLQLDILQKTMEFRGGGLTKDHLALYENNEVKIKNFTTCSANDGVNRFYPNAVLSGFYSQLFKIDTATETYKLNRFLFDWQILALCRYSKVPYFESFDYYTMLISILGIPEFFYTFFSSQLLKCMFWDSVFSEDDNEIVYLRLKNLIGKNKEVTQTEIFDILDGVELQTTILTHIMNLMT